MNWCRCCIWFTCSHTSIQHAALGLDAENKAQATPHTETVCVCVCVFTRLPISWPISISYVIIHVASWIPVRSALRGL